MPRPVSIRKNHCSGSALVEFALSVPLLLLLLSGVLNYSRALQTATALAHAARVGVQYGSRSTTIANDSAGIRAAVLNSAPDVKNMTVTSSCSCQCTGGAAVSCTGSCGGGKMTMYLQVTTRANASSVFGYTSLPYTGNAVGQATIRVK